MANLGKKADNQTEIAAQVAEFGNKADWSIRDWVWVFSKSQLLALNLSSTPTRVGDVMGRLWVFSEITEKYFSQLNLQEHSSKLESRNQALQLTQFSVDSAATPIFWIGSDARILYANQAACIALGYSPTELQDMKLYDIDRNFSVKNWAAHWNLIKQCGSLTLESYFLTKGRRQFPVEVTINYLQFDSNEFHCIFAIDISQRKEVQQALQNEKDHSERLLLNILPQEIAHRLQDKQGVIADVFEDATVLFADIVGFTEISAWLSSNTLVNMLNRIFSGFDELTQRYGLEKIKTIGDAYMVAGGLPKFRPDHAEAIADMALDMLQVIERFNAEQGESFSIRIGIHTGSVIAGVIGTKKFSYDLWGDT
ncbi:MAG TPA: PAS domain S-box protein, partial [Cyanobacteria bacterium UBA11148]|nr:PAS domain S-box protein [Cyanobacteria bacterium UBA11148]